MEEQKEIFCNEEIMDSIAEKFGLCEMEVRKIINSVEDMQQKAQEGYAGIAQDYSDSCFDLLLKHLRIVERCYEQLQNVTCTTKEMYLSTNANSERCIRGKE